MCLYHYMSLNVCRGDVILVLVSAQIKNEVLLLMNLV